MQTICFDKEEVIVYVFLTVFIVFILCSLTYFIGESSTNYRAYKQGLKKGKKKALKKQKSSTAI